MHVSRFHLHLDLWNTHPPQEFLHYHASASVLLTDLTRLGLFIDPRASPNVPSHGWGIKLVENT